MNDVVLLLGGTGRTGTRVMEELLNRGVSVRAIVRSESRVRADLASHPGLDLVQADIASLADDELRRQLADCTAVVSCLGHTLTLRGIFGPPRDLVADTVARVRRAAERVRPEVPIRFVVMTSVSVNRPGRADVRRGAGERFYLWLVRGLAPPASDNQRAADVLAGSEPPALKWVVVRPDALVDDDRSDYRLHQEIVDSLFRPDTSHFADIAHFFADLVTDEEVWRRWRGRMPVISSVR